MPGKLIFNQFVSDATIPLQVVYFLRKKKYDRIDAELQSNTPPLRPTIPRSSPYLISDIQNKSHHMIRLATPVTKLTA